MEDDKKIVILQKKDKKQKKNAYVPGQIRLGDTTHKDPFGITSGDDILKVKLEMCILGKKKKKKLLKNFSNKQNSVKI